MKCRASSYSTERPERRIVGVERCRHVMYILTFYDDFHNYVNILCGVICYWGSVNLGNISSTNQWDIVWTFLSGKANDSGQPDYIPMMITMHGFPDSVSKFRKYLRVF